MWRFVSPLLLFVASLVCGDDNLQRRAEVRKLCLESLYGLETHQKEGKIDTLLEMRKVMSNGSMTTRIFQNLLSDETRGQDTFNLHGRRILGACQLLANTYINETIFTSYARDIKRRHNIAHVILSEDDWEEFWYHFVVFLKKTVTIDKDVEQAWLDLGSRFINVKT